MKLIKSMVIIGFCATMIYSQVPKLHYAVTRFKPGGMVTQSDADLIADRLRIELFNTEKVTILEREEMNNILIEQGFQQSGVCDDQKCLVEMGQLLGVQFIVTGSIGSLGNLIMLNFRVVDISKGVVSATVARDISGSIESVVIELPTVAQQLLGISNLNPTATSLKQTNSLTETSTLTIATSYLNIIVYPKDVVTIINGKEVSIGDTLLAVPAGEYNIVCRTSDKKVSESQVVNVHSGETEDVNVRLKRRAYFSVGTNFSFMIGSSGQVGPAAELGLKLNKLFLGVQYFWGIENIWVDHSRADYLVDYEYSTMFGGGFIFGYVFHIGNVARITPAISLGFWREDISLASEYWRNEDSYFNMYFGGPKLRIEIGYKYIFLNADATFIIGTGGVKPLLNPGISCYF